MLRWLLVLPLLMGAGAAHAEAEYVETPYTEQQVVFDFYFDHPEKIGSALFWVRSLMNPLTDPPYNYAPEFLDLKVVLHGTELATLAKHNYERYADAVERMRYYASLGVEFKVCGLALVDFGYRASDLQDFVQVVPSAITELAHWQLEGYALITPTVLERHHSLEELR
ncbi:DsrE family protein [Ectothiorhodospiraceae bacterium 2226]|nr:DsrE family protein [Ectothiorhodospiraceae bacterium 2226]